MPTPPLTIFLAFGLEVLASLIASELQSQIPVTSGTVTSVAIAANGELFITGAIRSGPQTHFPQSPNCSPQTPLFFARG